MNKHQLKMINADNRKSNPALRFLYTTILGRSILKVLVQPFFSKICGFILETPISKAIISPFIKWNKLDMSRYKPEEYKSFNDFFKRRLLVPPDRQTLNKKYLHAPCDGKVSVYPIQQESVFSIKHSFYKLEELLEDTDLAKEYEDGTIWIFRLTPNDYHRYYFIDYGDIILFKHIPGILHTVQPIAFDYEKIFIKNSREISVMNTSYWGKVVQIEVGALLVGKITNEIKEGSFSFFQEKGYFEFGGSTVILLFKKNVLQPDASIFTKSQNGIETEIRVGTIIAKRGSIA